MTNQFNQNLLVQSCLLFGESDAHLSEIPMLGVKLHPQLTQALSALTQKAAAAGFSLAIASGFRSFERQLSIWDNKANGLRPVLDEAGRVLDISQLTDDQKVFAILRWSALPGASRHHWGTDFDVFDRAAIASDYELQLTVAETEAGGPFANFHQWLTRELLNSSYDFFRPYRTGVGSVSPEPWHLSYAPLANLFSAQLTETLLREKIQITDIALKSSILNNLPFIFDHYVKPYQGLHR